MTQAPKTEALAVLINHAKHCLKSLKMLALG
jgi:hypothetical protein